MYGTTTCKEKHVSTSLYVVVWSFTSRALLKLGEHHYRSSAKTQIDDGLMVQGSAFPE